MPEVEKAKRSRKLSLEFSKEEIKLFPKLSVGLTRNQHNRVDFQPSQALFVTGYHLRNLEYIRRMVVAQRAKTSRLYILDAARDLEELEKDNITQYSTRYQGYSDLESTTQFLETFLADNEEKTLILTNALEVFNLKELDEDLLPQILLTGETQKNVFLFSHSSLLAAANCKTEVSQTIYKKCEIMCTGLMIYRDLRELIGEEQAALYKKKELDKDETVILQKETDEVFTPYKLTSKVLLELLK